MPFPASAALQDFGALVLGNHALDLQQELVLRRLTDFSIEEDDLDPSPQELLQQQHLMGVVARQAIGTMDVELIDPPSSHYIAEPFQRGTHQGGAAGAIVDKLQFWSELEPTPGDAGVQIGHLALNRSGLLLHIRGDAGIQRCLDGVHGAFLSARRFLAVAGGASGEAKRTLRRTTGTRCEYARL